MWSLDSKYYDYADRDAIIAACVYNDIQTHISLLVESTMMIRSSSRSESEILTGIGVGVGFGVGVDKMLPAIRENAGR